MGWIRRVFARDKPPPGGAAGSDRQSLDFWDDGADPNMLWRSMLRYRAINEMRFSDPKIWAMWQLWMLPIRGASWDSEKPEHELGEIVNEAVQQQFGLQNHEGWGVQSWDSWLKQRLLMLVMGAMGGEIIWADDVEQWVDPAGERRAIRKMLRIAPRFPATVPDGGFKTDPVTGKLLAVVQQVPGAKPIPGDKLVWDVLNQEGTDYRGVSMLRPMYGSFRHKRALLTASGIAWDRWASGLVEVRRPIGSGRKGEEEARTIAKNVRAHEQAAVWFEGPEISDNTPQGWGFKVHTANIQDPVGLLRHHDEQMAAASLAMFSQLGITETGSRAVGETLSDAFHLGVLALAKQLASDAQQQAVRRFVDENFGRDVPAPKITVSKISTRTVADVVNAIVLLAGAGFNMRYRALLENLLDMLDLPHPDDDEPIIAEGESVNGGGNGGDGGAARSRVRRMLRKPRATMA